MKKTFCIAALSAAVVMISCAEKGPVTMGSLSEMDSLSYSIGVNLGSSFTQQLANIPLNYDEFNKGLEQAAFDKATMTKEQATDILGTFFRSTYQERSTAIAKQRAEQDSIRLASGDTTKVEYPVADAAMFTSEGERDSLSYALGVDVANNFVANQIDVQILWVQEAINDVRNDKAQILPSAANQFIQHYFTVTMPAKLRKPSEEWLAKIEKKSGVKKTESGLLYRIDKEGDNTVMATDSRDRVKVHYTGRTRDGKVFDSSIFENRSEEQQKAIKESNPDNYNANEPIEFPLNGVIAGWTEGLKLVGKGGKITLWIPTDIAYGARGAGADIKPYEALEFEVELLDVTPYEQPAPAEAPAK